MISCEMRPEPEFVSLVAALCDGTATREQRDDLEKLLERNAATREYYRAYVLLHVQLRRRFTAAEEVCASPLSDESGGAETHRGIHRVRQGFLSHSRWRGMGAAMAMVAASLGLLAYPQTPWNARLVRTQDSAETVARLGGNVDITWAKEVPADGELLVNGQRVTFQKGFTQIVFRGGAVEVLHDPASFDVKPGDAGQSRSGCLSAQAPLGSRGFAIHTSTRDVIELEAEFRVTTHDEGSAEVHVTQGSVEALIKDAQGKFVRSYQLREGEAIRVERSSPCPRRIALDRGRNSTPLRAGG